MQPFRREASFLVDYYGPVSNVWGTFPVYSLSSVIDNNDYDLKDYDEDNDWMDMYINDEHFLCAKSLQSSGFKHGFFTRSDNKKKSPDYLEKCLQSFSKSYFLEQVHGNKIIRVPIQEKNQSLITGDGLITNKRNQSLWVCTADCLPILFADTNSRIICAVHAGWRGLASKIIPNALSILENLGGNLKSLLILSSKYCQ